MASFKVCGGYLTGTQSMRTHPIRNITIEPKNWTEIKLTVGGKEIANIANENKILNFEMKIDNNYNIILYANGVKYYSDRHLYEFQLEFDSNKVSHKLVEHLIYDS